MRVPRVSSPPCARPSACRLWGGRRALDRSGKPLSRQLSGTVRVKVLRTVQFGGETWELKAAMQGLDETERYAAVKVAGFLGRDELVGAVALIAQGADWRLRLEARASLARMQPGRWTQEIREIAMGEGVEPEERLEAVFVLSEIPDPAATEALGAIAAHRRLDSELRAAAAWGLGQGAASEAEPLLPLISDEDELVALHAIAAIEQITDSQASTLSDWLGGEDRRAASAARVLQRLGRVEELLDACRAGGGRRLWALTALGDLPPSEVRQIGGPRLTDDLAELLAPLWAGQNDWLRSDDGKAGLDSLHIQKVRANPSAPRSLPLP